MAIPHCCPVCNGAGTTAKPPYVAGDQETWYASDCRFPCHACKGSGIVWEDTSYGTGKSDNRRYSLAIYPKEA